MRERKIFQQVYVSRSVASNPGNKTQGDRDILTDEYEFKKLRKRNE